MSERGDGGGEVKYEIEQRKPPRRWKSYRRTLKCYNKKTSRFSNGNGVPQTTTQPEILHACGIFIKFQSRRFFFSSLSFKLNT